jgi:hypothetical protein
MSIPHGCSVALHAHRIQVLLSLLPFSGSLTIGFFGLQWASRNRRHGREVPIEPRQDVLQSFTLCLGWPDRDSSWFSFGKPHHNRSFPVFLRATNHSSPCSIGTTEVLLAVIINNGVFTFSAHT